MFKTNQWTIDVNLFKPWKNDWVISSNSKNVATHHSNIYKGTIRDCLQLAMGKAIWKVGSELKARLVPLSSTPLHSLGLGWGTSKGPIYVSTRKKHFMVGYYIHLTHSLIKTCLMHLKNYKDETVEWDTYKIHACENWPGNNWSFSSWESCLIAKNASLSVRNDVFIRRLIYN